VPLEFEYQGAVFADYSTRSAADKKLTASILSRENPPEPDFVEIRWVGWELDERTTPPLRKSIRCTQRSSPVIWSPRRGKRRPTRSIMLNDEELARVESIAPFLLSEAKTALASNAHYTFTMELEMHVQPGLRIRSLVSLDDDPDSPPFPLDLFVGLPLGELRALVNAGDTERDALVARFGATFAPRLLRSIQRLAPHDVNYEAGCQSERGTLAVLLEDEG
jgi:hypothetical protein